MATIIDMPKLSDTMTEGTVANWLKNEGDAVASGDVIAEIETDKATMELEAFEDGVLLKQIIGVGGSAPVGSPIAAIGEAGETVDIPAAAAPATEAPAKEEPAPAAPTAPAPTPAVSEPAAPAAAPVTASGPVKASPLAKKLAQEAGIDLSTIKGSGPNGRVVKKDVLEAQKAGPAPAAAAAAPAVAAPVLPGQQIAVDEEIPVSKMRSVIAQRLTESKTTAPHFYLEIEMDSAPLLKLRANLNKELAELPPEKGGIKFTVNDFILKATTEAIRRVPAINRSWNGTTIKQNGSVHLAFGVAIEDGLLTPVVRDAESKSLKQVALEAKSLIGKARSKKLTPNEMSGSTFTVTNLGMFGVSSFYGIINTPNAGILSVGATIDKPVVNKAGEIVPGKVMKIGLSCDHRAIDGAVGAQFLAELKKIIETPSLILV
ncbi:2-oxo acid dehydrogenase subunit E2 [Puniceicoccaceae bacterium K14]|nr:2-oxo acid dehydrogenase subunit E2 [Puniceicoccaceae bacterium K14]